MTTVLTAPQFPFDPTGVNPLNRVTNELQPLTGVGDRDYYYVVPASGPFFATSLQMSFKSVQGELRPLYEGIDYQLTHYFLGASRATAKPIYGSVTLLNKQLNGTLIFNSYQSLGGEWTVDSNTIATILAQLTVDPRATTWDNVAGYPTIFPVIDHEWNLVDMVGQTQMLAVMDRIVDAILTQASSAMSTHINTFSGNPHKVTCADIDAVSRTELSTVVANAVAGTIVDTDSVAEGSSNKYFTSDRVRQSQLSGYVVTQVLTQLGEGDTFLVAFGKLQAQIKAQLATLDTKANVKRPAFIGLGSQNLVKIIMPGTISIDITQSEAFQLAIGGSGSIAFNVDQLGDMTDKVIEFSVTTVNSAAGYAIAWPSNVKWVDGVPPPRSTAVAARDYWYFVSEDGGVTWTGSLSNLNPH